VKPATSRPIPNPDQAPPPARVRMLARMFERHGASSRANPEQVTLTKYLIGGQLRRLARDLERCSRCLA
jgi:hypothetical protein